ncbi:hypothetical protein Taro_052930 [Colocasia esculenta]|uniref:Uncharacterized protein n=1 Tax=Colocasia esculenta TaxID=4460 RepID=A0A843XJL2_COLES|nr:hypothetical protein [Colocasia esculenta]
MLVLCRETLVSRGCSGVPRAPLSRRVCAEGLLPHVFDSAGSAGVMFGLTRGVVELFEFIAYLTRLNSNPSRSSDPWVATRPSGVPGSRRSGCYSGIRAQGSNEICNGLITMVVPKKGTRALLARLCRVALKWAFGLCCRWLSFQQGLSVSCRRVLLLLLGAHAASVVAVFARDAVGFILGLHVRVCVLLAMCLALHACALLGAMLCSVGVFARAKQMLVYYVAPLVERCDTWLWLLSALCWLVVNSDEVLPEFFSVGSGGEWRLALWVEVL